jgi:hypothetical protein
MLTASNLVNMINQLPRNRYYNYINQNTTTRILIDSVRLPEGPIHIKRYDPSSGETEADARKQSISTTMIWRIANAIRENFPLNVDRILGASYNTRSAFESLLAYTPEFFWCLPGRIEIINQRSQIKRGHKHLIFKPNTPHELGLLVQTESNLVISEIPSIDVVYDALVLPEAMDLEGMDIEVVRRHSQIQIALLKIGLHLGSRVWIAQNDRGISYEGTRIGEMEGVIARLEDMNQIRAYEAAIRAATMIDLIWFKNARFMPAVFEVEHTTGILSGLTRMKELKDQLPPSPTKWVIVAEDGLRERVLEYSNREQFRDLQAKYMSYHSVEELYYLCQRRNLRGVNDEFLDCYMENCLLPTA